jgi:hypothetical protein
VIRWLEELRFRSIVLYVFAAVGFLVFASSVAGASNC